MGITTPEIFTYMHDEEFSRDRPVNENTVLKLIQNHNYLSDLMVPGTIALVQVNQPGSPAVDPSIWQRCDGSEITHPLSPLRTIGASSRYVPLFDDPLVKAAAAAVGSPASAGNHSFTFFHNHGGATGARDNTATNGDVGNTKLSTDQHAHVIKDAVDGLFNFDYPPWFKVAAYMKIR